MKTYVHCDLNGRIMAIIQGDVPEGAGFMLTPAPGLVVAEVESLSKLKPIDFGRTAKTHRVLAPSFPSVRLEKKPKRAKRSKR